MFLKKFGMIILPLLVLLIGCQNNQVNYKDVTVNEAKQMIDQGKVIILDVRTPEEFEEGHIRNAVLMPLQDLSKTMAELDSNQSYLVVCRSGNRSAQASELLIQNGFKNVYNMTGGMTKWDGETVR